MVRILVFLILSAPASAQVVDAIVWRYGYAEHISARGLGEGERVIEWPSSPCGHAGHVQRGLGPRPTDEELESLRLEYIASPEYAKLQLESQEHVEGVTSEMREMDALIESLVESGVLSAASVAPKVRKRINRRRSRRGESPL